MQSENTDRITSGGVNSMKSDSLQQFNYDKSIMQYGNFDIQPQQD